MTTKSLLHSSLLDNQYYTSMLVGNDAYNPSDEDILAEEVLASSQASVTFSSLGDYATAGYQHLQIRATMDATGNFGTAYDAYITLNGDTGSNYYSHGLRGNGSSVSSFNYGPNYLSLALLTASTTSDASSYAANIVDILDPFETTKNTTVRVFAGHAAYQVALQSVLWNSTAALTSFTITPHGSTQFVSGSRFTLIGLK